MGAYMGLNILISSIFLNWGVLGDLGQSNHPEDGEVSVRRCRASSNHKAVQGPHEPVKHFSCSQDALPEEIGSVT